MKINSKTLDMTEGKAVRLLLVFAVPMLIGNLFQQLYNVADSIIVGRMIGSDALGAVGATNSVTFLFFALCNGIGSGGGIVVSQFFGAGSDDRLRKCMTNVAYIMVVFPLLVGSVAYALTEPLLVYLKTPDEILADSIAYMHIMCIGIVFVSMYNYISSMLRALGDSTTPLIFLIFSCLLNIVLDIYFVNIGLGVRGAAIATILSQFISGAGCIVYALFTNPYFKFTREDMRPDGKIMIKVVQLGIPLSLQFAMIAVSCMALQRVVNSFGTVAVATFAVTGRIENVIHQPYQTLGSALSTYTGQNYGAGKNERVIKGYHDSLRLMALFTLLMVPVMQLFGRFIMGIFSDDPEVIEMGATALRITSLFYIFLGIIYVVRGVQNGLGDGIFALFNGIIEVAGRLSLPLLLTGMALFGHWGIWWSAGIVWMISGVTAWLRYITFRKRCLGI